MFVVVPPIVGRAMKHDRHLGPVIARRIKSIGDTRRLGTVDYGLDGTGDVR